MSSDNEQLNDESQIVDDFVVVHQHDLLSRDSPAAVIEAHLMLIAARENPLFVTPMRKMPSATKSHHGDMVEL